MKLTFILLTAAFLQVQAGGHAQTVTLSLDNAPLKTALTAIEKQTPYHFLYNDNIFTTTRPVTLQVKNAALEDVLAICFKEQPVSYTMMDNYIVLKEKDTTGVHNNLLQTDITGRVTNAQGEPLAGANVVVQRTKRGTITDADGNFALHNVTSDDFMDITYIGYKKLTIKVGSRTSFTLIMDIATDELDKAVVQAYGTTTQRLATGSISKVTSEEIRNHPVMNPIEALQGNVPGATLTNVSGYASAPIKIEVRGRNTIDPTIPSEPLYIIDGVPMTILNQNTGVTAISGGSVVPQGVIQTGIASPAGGQSVFFNISPNDIASIEVLKDADATAIYGSRGSNGVIIITTKKGMAGKTHGEFNVYTGYSKVPRFYSMLNTQQYVQMRREAITNDGMPVNIYSAPDLVSWDTTRYTDWQKYAYGNTGKVLEAQASLSGGNKGTTFRTSAEYSYQRDVTTTKGGNTRGSFSLNLNHKSKNQKLSLSWSSIYSITSIDAITTGGSVLLPPNAPPVFDNAGKLNYIGWNPLSGIYSFDNLLQPYKAQTNLLNSNFILNYEIIKGLLFKANLGYNNVSTDQTFQIPIASQNPLYNPKGTSRFGFTKFHNLIFEPQIEYTSFISKGKLSLLAGSTIQTNKTDGLQNTGINYTNDLLINSINNAPNKIVVDNYGEYKYTGIFARLNYNWRNKYIINVNARRDGTSRFGPGKQFGNFGSVGAAWIFTDEKWIKRLSPFLSFGKFRGSYGRTGSDQIGDYDYLNLWQFGRAGTYNSYVPIFPVGLSDSLIQWEVNRKFELSLSLGFLNDKIIFESSFYRNRCDNQLVYFPTPALTGFTNVTANSPANVENSGWEFLIKAKVIDKKVIKIESKLNISINRNKLISYPNFSQSPFVSSFVIGKPLNIQRYLHVTGVDPQTGLYKFQDKNGDQQITKDLTGKSEDDRYIYDLTPKFEGGFTTNATFKNWSLSIFFYFRKQIGFSATSATELPGTLSNQPTAILNRWQKVGDITDIGKFTTFSSSNTDDYLRFSDARICDASFIRLQNVILSYQIPDNIKNKLGINGLKLFIQGENLLLITKYKGVDPEVQNFGGLPRTRIITVGLSFNL